MTRFVNTPHFKGDQSIDVVVDLLGYEEFEELLARHREAEAVIRTFVAHHASLFKRPCDCAICKIAVDFLNFPRRKEQEKMLEKLQLTFQHLKEIEQEIEADAKKYEHLTLAGIKKAVAAVEELIGLHPATSAQTPPAEAPRPQTPTETKA